MRWFCRLASVVAALAAIALAAHRVHARLPAEGMVATGTRLAGLTADGRTTPEAMAREAARTLSQRRVELTHQGGTVWSGTLAELGATVAEQQLARALGRVGREGDPWARLDEAEQARRGEVEIAPGSVWLPLEPLAARLEAFKARHDRSPEPARWSFSRGASTPHRDGLLVDVPATVAAVEAAARTGRARVEVAVRASRPRATSAAVAAIDRTALVSRYETRFAFSGNQRGRGQNVARAAAGLDGAVLLPGRGLSFNRLVGPRSLDNGFAQAGEIYKGELRVGVGGGTCQVASTFHAAAYLGGLRVAERSPHSRPSGYIPIGLDATVAYPHVDLRIDNPFDFAIVVHATATEGVMRVELYGARRPATVSLTTATVGVKKYERKIRRAFWLAEGQVLRKQAGRRGVVIEKVRSIRYRDGTQRSETTRDVYPPTTEIYVLPPGADESTLPPLPAEAG